MATIRNSALAINSGSGLRTLGPIQAAAMESDDNSRTDGPLQAEIRVIRSVCHGRVKGAKMTKKTTTIRSTTSHNDFSADKPLRAETRSNESRDSITEAEMKKSTRTPSAVSFDSDFGIDRPLQAETRSMRNESHGRVKGAKRRKTTTTPSYAASDSDSGTDNVDHCTLRQEACAINLVVALKLLTDILGLTIDHRRL